MIKIDEIKIRNFKNIQSADIVLNDYNLIVGPNNSGKSNFLQVFKFLDWLFSSSIDDVKYAFESDYFGPIGRVKPSIASYPTETELELKFSNSSTGLIFDYMISILWKPSADDEFIGRISREYFCYKAANKPGRFIKVFERTSNSVQFGEEYGNTKIIDEVQSFFSVLRLLYVLPDNKNPYNNEVESLSDLVKNPVYYFASNELNNASYQIRKDEFGRIIAFDLAEEISKIIEAGKIKLFKSVLFSTLKIRDVKLIEPSVGAPPYEHRNVLFGHFDSYKSSSLLSDGSVLMISLLTKILSSDNSILLIEEPENSLHPKALVELNKFMNSFTDEKQFIIVSHSLTLLNLANPKDVIIAKSDENGQSTLENVSGRKDILKKLKSGYADFSDIVFFPENSENEFD